MLSSIINLLLSCIGNWGLLSLRKYLGIIMFKRNNIKLKFWGFLLMEGRGGLDGGIGLEVYGNDLFLLFKCI